MLLSKRQLRAPVPAGTSQRNPAASDQAQGHRGKEEGVAVAVLALEANVALVAGRAVPVVRHGRNGN